MGWNIWNHFAGKINDKTVREIADAMVSSGMKDAGYLYVNIDDTWEAKRDAQGNIQSNSKFPDIKALADYVHGKGLRIGIYSSPGPQTCAGDISDKWKRMESIGFRLNGLEKYAGPGHGTTRTCWKWATPA